MRIASILMGILLGIPGCASLAGAQELPKLFISAPGPRNLSYLPIDLIPVIGADRAEGVDLEIVPVGGGAVALKNLTQRNVDFAVAGVPAAMSQRANGDEVVVVAPVDDAPLFVLMVRSGLRGKVNRIADLKGKVIGVNTSTKSSKTTSQQLMELLLRSDGVPLDAVRIVPAGQSWVEQSSLMKSATADAVMGDEPFASRLLTEGSVFFLANLADPATIGSLKEANFLHAALETRAEVIAEEPEKVAKMVRMLKKSLAWITTHTATEIVERLKIEDREESQALQQALEKYPRAFKGDGRFSTGQLRNTEAFFHQSMPHDPKALALTIESMVDDRWAGRIP
ncbi:MAG: ABC transporter substrate-binding protein [Magnetococcales bacterium]|nr:ABC transporter substrate-binding protein [Magnetococcales bacterium]